MAAQKKAPETAPETEATTAQVPASGQDEGARPEKVAQARYSSKDFPLGGRAGREVVRRFDEGGVLEDATDGPLQPGERGVIVVNEGGKITRGVRYELGIRD